MRLQAPNHLVVSERNLRALLAKLNGFPPDSACTIVGGVGAEGFILQAEPDDVHYANRVVPPGPMTVETERALREEAH